MIVCSPFFGIMYGTQSTGTWVTGHLLHPPKPTSLLQRDWSHSLQVSVFFEGNIWRKPKREELAFRKNTFSQQILLFLSFGLGFSFVTSLLGLQTQNECALSAGAGWCCCLYHSQTLAGQEVCYNPSWARSYQGLGIHWRIAVSSCGSFKRHWHEFSKLIRVFIFLELWVVVKKEKYFLDNFSKAAVWLRGM